jgi:hypothetical protein
MTEFAHGHPERDDAEHFTLGLQPPNGFDLWFRWTCDDGEVEWHQIVGLEVQGAFAFAQAPLTFDVFELQGRAFGATVAKVFGNDSVFVASPRDDNPDEVTISWRALSDE